MARITAIAINAAIELLESFFEVEPNEVFRFSSKLRTCRRIGSRWSISRWPSIPIVKKAWTLCIGLRGSLVVGMAFLGVACALAWAARSLVLA